MSTTVEYILEIDSKGAQKGLKQTERQAKKTTRSVKSLRSSARGMSGSFQAVGEAAGFMAPELSGLAEVAMVGARTFRGLGRTLASGNPIIIGLTLAIGGAIAAFAVFNAANKREKESVKALSKAIEENTKKINKNNAAFLKSENAILNSAGKVNELALQYAVLSGDISKSEAAETKRAFKAEQAASKLETQLEAQIKAKQDSLKVAKDTVKATKKRLDDLSAANNLIKRGGDLTIKGVEARAKEEAALKSVRVLERDISNLRTDGQKRIQAQADQYIKLQAAIAKETERQRKRDEAIGRAKERQTKLQGILNGLQAQAASLADRLLSSQMARMQPAERINAEYQKEIANLVSIEQGIIKQFAAAEKVARTKNDSVLLTQIQSQKEASLANIQALRSEAQIKRQKQIFGLVAKGFAIQIKGISKTGASTGKRLQKMLQAQRQVNDIVKIANEDQLSALDKINEAEKERLATLQKIAKEQNINTEEAKRAVKARADRERAAFKQQQIAGGIGVATTVIQAATDPNALISAVGSAFGPIGSAVAGAVGALSDLGQRDPEEVKEQFKATFEGIAQGIKILIPLLIEALPPLLFDAARLIVDALIQLPFAILASIGKLIKSVVDGIKDFFSGKGFFEAIGSALMGMFERLIDLIVEPFKGLFGGSKMGGGRMLSGQGGLRFTGANRGLAMLHEGEMVVPRTGQMSSTVAQDVQAASGGKSINITINSAITERSAIDSLVRKIEQRFGSYGQSTSPLFGGT
jgi:hypothetical protein